MARSPGARVYVIAEAGVNHNGDPALALELVDAAAEARADAALGAGGFDETLPNAQDFDLWLALLKDPAAEFHVFEAPLVRYHVSEHGIMSRTESRLRCGLRIAVRHAASLRARRGSALASLWFRVCAIHYEAACSYARRRRFPRMAALLVQAPVNLIRATFLHVFGRAQPRAAFIEAPRRRTCVDAAP